jgi:hypothetical protein
MPLRQIRKHKNSKSKSKSRSRSRKTKRQQRGGDPGRVALPMANFLKSGTPGYYPDGDPALQGNANQKSVSHGVVWPGGNWAGPNLYPQLGGRKSQRSRNKSHRGGSCGCNGARRSKRKTQIRKH